MLQKLNILRGSTKNTNKHYLKTLWDVIESRVNKQVLTSDSS